MPPLDQRWHSFHNGPMDAEAMPVVGVGAVVRRDGRILLVKRAHPPHAGLWAIPGGKVRPGESLQAAAEREILEETGVRIRAGGPVHAFDLVERDDQGRVTCHYVVVDLAAEYLGGEPRAGSDAAGAGWFSEEELATLPLNPDTAALLRRLRGRAG